LGIITLYLKLFNEISDSYEIINIKAMIIESDFDIIVGKPDIVRHNLINNVTNKSLETFVLLTQMLMFLQRAGQIASAD